MSKDNPKNEVAVSTPGQLPAYLQEQEHDTGRENVSQFVKPPRLKIVQKQANDQLLEQFNIGDLIATPANVMAAAKGETFAFAPIFFFPEWCTWNPYELKGTLPTIAERTFDPEHPLVAKCRNPKTREEDYPELVNGKTVQLRHCEHLNYLMQIISGPLAGATFLQSFFRAQHQDGTNFAQLIGMRDKRAPLYSMQFEAKTYHKEYGGNSWYGLRVSNPQSVEAFASPEDFELRKEMFEQFNISYGDGSLVVDLEEGSNESAAEVDEAKAAF